MNDKKNAGLRRDCPVCHGENIEPWIFYEKSQTLDHCKSCGLGYLAPYPTELGDLYQDYGDYITQLPPSYFKGRLRISLKKRIIYLLVKRVLGKDAYLLDYGGGAGFFVGCAKKLGLGNSYLFEPSDNFRRAAVDKVGLDESHVVADLDDLQIKFKFVSMLDVIEHLPQEKLHLLLSELTSKMELGGYLLGETPNKGSLNLKIFGAKDPVIAPPSHLTYFTKKSLHQILVKHGFKRTALITWGLSTNSFFRKSKFTPSFVEQPKTAIQRVLSFFIRSLFAVLGAVTVFTGTGYQIIFLYRLEERSQ